MGVARDVADRAYPAYGGTDMKGFLARLAPHVEWEEGGAPPPTARIWTGAWLTNKQLCHKERE